MADKDDGFQFGPTFEVTEHIKSTFDERGYIVVRNVFGDDEISKLKEALEKDDGIKQHAYEIGDGGGGKVKLCIWSLPGQDITGMVARCDKIAGTMEKLFGAELYHYSCKLMMKEAKTGGQHTWHQDYGYWYKDGCLFSDMGTVFIAVDESNKTNGCLQVIPGSHKCGRIEHVIVGGQTGADTERVKQVQNKLGLEYVEMKPGDALFFHSNLLHKSNANSSETRRWAFLVAYNSVDNKPYNTTNPHFIYEPLKKVPNDAVLKCSVSDISGKDFWNPRNDKTIVYDDEL
ncbi:unnamed protein product [Owenia fusiformis]|uniref:Uncharacterized protein n=1 Tax=Owenia fusiformis TaxID=6347 RepID=A0A8J1YA86_OWEFU|nr:unnamed protein product [Owenia fusiformis]